MQKVIILSKIIIIIFIFRLRSRIEALTFWAGVEFKSNDLGSNADGSVRESPRAPKTELSRIGLSFIYLNAFHHPVDLALIIKYQVLYQLMSPSG